jgi:hypothetical protein
MPDPIGFDSATPGTDAIVYRFFLQGKADIWVKVMRNYSYLRTLIWTP